MTTSLIHSRQALAQRTLSRHRPRGQAAARRALCRAWRRPLLLLGLLVSALLLPALGQAAELTSSVDRQRVSLQETLSLTLRYDGQVLFGEPDFSPLEKDFEILANQRSNQYRSINGQAESWTQWSLTLAPRREGNLEIPALAYEGARSKPIAIEVNAARAGAGPGSEQPIFLETELDKEQVHVQEQLLLTLRLYTSVDLRGLNSEELKVDNALVKQVAENQYQKVIDGRHYGVVEVIYAIFPQQSGTLTLPSVVWNATLQDRRNGFGIDPFFNRGGRRQRLRSETRELEVLPRAANFSGRDWLPARQLELQQSWSRDPEEFRVGEPITRKISIVADGLMASQIPALELPPADGVRYYPDQPQARETLSASGVRSDISESYAIVPNRAGSLTLPAVEVVWWDSESRSQRSASLPAQSIQVRPAARTSAAPSPSAVTTAERADHTAPATGPSQTLLGASYWFYSTLALALACLLLLDLWLRERRRGVKRPAKPGGPVVAEGPTEKTAYRQLGKALQSGEPAAMRTALLTWATAYLSHPVRSLGDIERQLPDLGPALQTLQRNLYGQPDGSPGPDCTALQHAIARLRRHGPSQPQAHVVDGGLPPLYQ